MLTTTLIEIPSWGNVTLIEAIWLASGLIALSVTAVHLGPLYEDYIAAKISGRAILGKVAWGYVRRELIRMAQGICLVTIGAYAAIEPPSRPGPTVVSLVGLVLTAVLFILSFLVSLQSVFDWRTREEVQRLIAAGENGVYKTEPQPEGEQP